MNLCQFKFLEFFLNKHLIFLFKTIHFYPICFKVLFLCHYSDTTLINFLSPPKVLFLDKVLKVFILFLLILLNELFFIRLNIFPISKFFVKYLAFLLCLLGVFCNNLGRNILLPNLVHKLLNFLVIFHLCNTSKLSNICSMCVD